MAEHLSSTYGDRAHKVAKLAQLTGLSWPVVGRRLHPEYPYIEAEVMNYMYLLGNSLDSHTLCLLGFGYCLL